MGEDRPIRILLVDDHAMVRKGVELFLGSDPAFQVVGQAGNGEEAIRYAAELQPDVICMDLVMPGAEVDGITAIQVIHHSHPNIHILALTSFIDLEKVLAAIQGGADGYLMKDANPQELARAIHAVARGEMYLHPEAARKLAHHLGPEKGDRPGTVHLTPREEDVLRLVARGLNNQQVAEDLDISLKTVKAHMSSIMQKLGIENRVQAALYALQHNIVSLEDL